MHSRRILHPLSAMLALVISTASGHCLPRLQAAITEATISPDRINVLADELERLGSDLTYICRRETHSLDAFGDEGAALREFLTKCFEDSVAGQYPSYLEGYTSYLSLALNGLNERPESRYIVSSQEYTRVGARSVQHQILPGRFIGSDLVDGDLRLSSYTNTTQIVAAIGHVDPRVGIQSPSAIVKPLSTSDRGLATFREAGWKELVDWSGRYTVLRHEHESGTKLTCVFERNARFPFLVISRIPLMVPPSKRTGLSANELQTITFYDTLAPTYQNGPSRPGFPFTEVISFQVSPFDKTHKVERWTFKSSAFLGEDGQEPVLPLLPVNNPIGRQLIEFNVKTGERTYHGKDASQWPELYLRKIDFL